jgi:hypothetical protein
MRSKYTCSRCQGHVESNARPDRIDGKPVCGPCFWAPAPSAPTSPASPPPAPAATPAPVVALPRCASFADLDPDERRAFRRAA